MPLSRIAVAALLLLVVTAAGALPAGPRAPTAAAVPAGRVIVEVDAAPMHASERGDRSLLKARVGAAVDGVVEAVPAGVTVERRFDGVPAFVATADAEGVRALQAHPGVRSVTPDLTVVYQTSESARLIRADEVHTALGVTGAGVTVAIIDSGIDTDHPDLVGDIAFEECYMVASGCPMGGGTHTSGPGSAEDQFGHGTEMAGVITSTGNQSGRGIAPDTEVGMYKISGAAGGGSFSDVLASLNDIIVNHPEVRAVNMSLGDGINRGASCDALFPPMTTAITTLLAANTLVFVASGNEGYSTGVSFPACISNVVSVGGVWDDSNIASHGVPACTETPVFDRVMCMSNSVASLDLLAPGGHINTSAIGGGDTFGAGTSQATPHAVAAAAILWAINGSLTSAQVEAALEANGVPRTDPKNALVTPRIDLWKSAASIIGDPDGDAITGPSDNCPLDTNVAQGNNDRNYIDNSPPYAPATDDKTFALSDNMGDACDPDDDNDGLTDAEEAVGSAFFCFLIPTNPLVGDTDGDRFLDGGECALFTNPTSAASFPPMTSCAPVGDTDGDKISDRVEICFYHTSIMAMETDADASTGGAKDGCEIASFNGDDMVNSGDQGMLGAGIVGTQPYTANVDVNKDGVLNSGDQGLQASFIVPPGQCP